MAFFDNAMTLCTHKEMSGKNVAYLALGMDLRNFTGSQR